jgi:hypothetical protein
MYSIIELFTSSAIGSLLAMVFIWFINRKSPNKPTPYNFSLDIPLPNPVVCDVVNTLYPNHTSDFLVFGYTYKPSDIERYYIFLGCYYVFNIKDEAVFVYYRDIKSLSIYKNKYECVFSPSMCGLGYEYALLYGEWIEHIEKCITRNLLADEIEVHNVLMTHFPHKLW